MPEHYSLPSLSSTRGDGNSQQVCGRALLLSIVIPTHCRVDLLARCLRSVTSYVPSGTEIIVVDDGSPEARASAVASSFPEVNSIRLRRQRGFCTAVNAGIAAARGDIIELLNDDTEVTPGWGNAALAAFADSAVGAVAPLVLDMATKSSARPRIDSAGDRYYVAGVAGKRGYGQRLEPEYLQAGFVFGASGSSAFYRRKALLEVGALPESFGAYFEDVDLAFRLRRAGYQIVFEPASRVYHQIGASHGRAGRRLLEQQSRNEERVYWRNLPAPTLARSLPLHAAVLVGKALRRWSEGTLSPFIFGRLRLLGEIPDLVRHRRQLAAAFPTADAATWLLDRSVFGQRRAA